MTAEPPATDAEDSLRKRYIYKLGIGVAGVPISVVTQSVIPRMLGPAAYGNFSFLTAFFLQIVAFWDAGLSSAFYSKLSQRQREPGLLRFFWGVTAVLSGLIVLTLSVVFALRLDAWLWPDQQSRFVWMAAVWGLITWYGLVINKVTDAYGLTASSEVVRLVQRLFGLGLLLVVFKLGVTGLGGFFAYQYTVLLFLCAGWWVVLRRRGRHLFPSTALTKIQLTAYLAEFFEYSAPLLVFQVVGLLSGVMDRWLLQRFAGSVEQGFFALSYQIGALCFMMTGAMAPLFWREIAKAHGTNDLEGMRVMFRRYVPLLYSIAAFLAMFVAVHARKVSAIVGGPGFDGAIVPVAIMACYPVHQTYGQMNAAFLMATGQTRVYRNLGLVSIVLQMGLTFWLLAPPRLSGLGLGAAGLALTMVIAQFLGVNLQLWFISGFLRVRFTRFLGHQLYSAGVLALVAWVTAWTVDRVIPNPLWSLIVSGAFYFLCCAGLLFLIPSIAALSRDELYRHLASTWGAVRVRVAPR